MRLVFIVFFAFVAGAFGQERFIVELSSEPAIERFSALKGERRAAFAARRAAVRSAQQSVRRAMEQEGAEVLDSVDTVANALIVRMPEDRLTRVRTLPGVMRVHRARQYKMTLDHAVQLNRIADAWAMAGGIGKAGAGIKIGIIDTGIDISHPAFQDADLPQLDGYPIVNRDTDTVYTNRKVIVARSYDRETRAGSLPSPARDRVGHGTGVAMVAAGGPNSGPRASITGVAPKAYLGNYKVFPDSGETAPTDLILRAIDDAVVDGMDIINLSLGSVVAERPENDILVTAVERATAAGLIVVVAAGNEGPDLNTVGSPGTAPSAVTVGNSHNDRIFAALATIDDRSYVMIPGSGRNSTRPVTAEIFDAEKLDQNGLACGELPAGPAQGKILLILRGNCNFEDKLKNAQTAGAVAALVYTHAESPEASGMAVGAATIPAGMIGNADGLDLKSRLREGATVTMRFDSSPFSVNPGRLNASSSRGPSSGLTIKPELVAVGTSIYTATTSASSTGVPSYMVASGTSLSSPLVAGAAAVLKAQRPGLTPAQYRSLLINSSDTFTTAEALPVQQAGTGQMNLISALRSTTAVAPAALAFGSTAGSVDVSRNLTITNLGNAAETLGIEVRPLSGSAVPTLDLNAVQLGPNASRDVVVRLQGSNLSPGTYQGFLVIRGAQSGIESRVPYWFAVPSREVRQITILDAPATGTVGNTYSILFRPTEASGLPAGGEPEVSVASGEGSVVRTVSGDSMVPGLWSARVRLGAGANEFRIKAGERETIVSITGR